MMQAHVAVFGNNRSWAINRRYKRYLEQSRRTYRAGQPKDAGTERQARALAEQGYVALPSSLNRDAASALRDKVDALFADPANTIRIAPGVQRLLDGIERVPEIERLVAFGGIGQLMETYFGSNFKIYLASFYRTVPDDSKPESSFLWHFDNAVDEEVKVMIYLDDVTEETGALRVKSLALSNEARRLGFWHRQDYDRARPVFDDESTTDVLEGGPGTAIFFRAGRVIHKATAPRRGHRDVVTLVMIPSTIPWREHYARNRHLLSTNAGICVDPRTDRPQNIGYHF